MTRKALTPIRLSLETVRTLAIVKQGLHRRPPLPGNDTLLEAIRRIGLLQLDSVNVVARSHYLETWPKSWQSRSMCDTLLETINME